MLMLDSFKSTVTMCRNKCSLLTVAVISVEPLQSTGKHKLLKQDF